MNTASDTSKVRGKRRGCLRRAAVGLLAFLVILMAAGAIYQAAASASDLNR